MSFFPSTKKSLLSFSPMQPDKLHRQSKGSTQKQQKPTLPIWVQMQEEEANLINVSAENECRSDFLADFQEVEESRAEDQKAKYHRHHQQQQASNAASSANTTLASHADEWHSLDLENFPQYVINRMGHVKNICTNRVLPSCTKEVPDNASRRVTLTNNSSGHEQTFCLHLLVAQKFVRNPNPHWHSVYHLDSKKSNCRADNLFWGPQNGTIPDLTKAAYQADAVTASSSRVSRYSRHRHKCGLIIPYTWSLRIKKNCWNDWRPYLTIFHPADLFADFGLLPSSSEEEFSHQTCASSYDYPRDTIECAPIYKNQELNWKPWNGGEEGHYIPVMVSMHGVIWDQKQHLIGSGCVSLRHGGRKVYLPHLSKESPSQEAQEEIQQEPRPKSKTPYHAVDSMVLEAWLGSNYWKSFLGHDCVPEQGFQVYHIDGNIHHNHLFNLLVVPHPTDGGKRNLTCEQQFETLFTILDRVEPIWEHYEVRGMNRIPGITPTYARTIMFEQLSQ